MIKSDLLINTNGYVLSLLEKILDANIEIKGIENIPIDNPKMFEIGRASCRERVSNYV